MISKNSHSAARTRQSALIGPESLKFGFQRSSELSVPRAIQSSKEAGAHKSFKEMTAPSI